MPRILWSWAFVGACAFHADYTGGQYTCGDGKCPSGLICSAKRVCVTGIDAGVDANADAMLDARPAALTCADPGPFPAAGGTTLGSTTGRSSTISATCAGFVMNGPDAVYRVDATAGGHVMLTISGSYPVNAYLIAPCLVTPATPLCEGNAAAAPGIPIDITAAATGSHFVVVDGVNAVASGTYTLTVAVTP